MKNRKDYIIWEICKIWFVKNRFNREMKNKGFNLRNKKHKKLF